MPHFSVNNLIAAFVLNIPAITCIVIAGMLSMQKTETFNWLPFWFLVIGCLLCHGVHPSSKEDKEDK